MTTNNKVTMQVTMAYVAEKVDGFTRTEAHYIAGCDTMTEKGLATSERSAIENLREIKAAEINKAKGVVEDATQIVQPNRVRSWDIDVVVVNRVDYRPEELVRIQAEEEKKARETAAYEAAKAKEQAMHDEIKTRLGDALSRYVHLDTYCRGGWMIQVNGVRERQGNRRSYKAIADRRFPIGKKGFNWDKIREAAQHRADYDTRKHNERVALEQKVATVNEIKKDLGLTEYDSVLAPSGGKCAS